MACGFITCENRTKTQSFEQIFRQLVVEDGAGCLVLQTTGGGGAGAVVRTPGLVPAAGPGAVAAGFRSVTIAVTGAAPGVIMGVPVPAGAVFTWAAGGENDTLAGFAYDATGTAFLITTVL